MHVYICNVSRVSQQNSQLCKQMTRPIKTEFQLSGLHFKVNVWSVCSLPVGFKC